MKRFFSRGSLGFLFLLMLSATAQAQAPIQNDTDMLKQPVSWRSHAPHLPSFNWGTSIGFTPNYFAPTNAENVQPYVTGGLSLGMSWALAQAGVTNYWRDLSFSVGWGLSKALTDNMGAAQYARQVYARNIGVSIGKRLFTEPNTGITLSFGVSGSIPVSMAARQRTQITALGARIGLSKRFFNILSLSYGFGSNFNFYVQDSGLYNPELAGIPGLNQRWGMSHGLNMGISTPIRGLSLSAGLSVGIGYSFADAYAAPDGPQVFGAENLTQADLASYAINEGNSFGISIGLGYTINRFLRIGVSYNNFGRQFEWQFDNNGNTQFVLRNPFKLQNGSFRFSLGGSI